MTNFEAIKEIFDNAAKPRIQPDGMPSVELSGPALEKAILAGDIKGRYWNESLTESQQVVAKWLWEKCFQYVGDVMLTLNSLSWGS